MNSISENNSTDRETIEKKEEPSQEALGMASDSALQDLQINKQTIDLLIANVIPTTKYFESRFDHMQYQIDTLKDDMKDFRSDVDKRFVTMQADIDKRFDAVDQRFVSMQAEMDKRFDAVDRRFEKVMDAIEKLGEKLDGRDERQRNFTIRMFTISITISILGVLGVFLKSFGIL